MSRKSGDAPWAAQTSEELGRQVTELRRANKTITGSRRAALNLLEDAVEARERAEHTAEALAESEQRFRSLVEAHAQAVWETDAAGKAVVDSPSWRAFTGQTLEEWVGCGWVGAVHPDDRAHAERQWREAVIARRKVDAEFRMRHVQGDYRWTNVRVTPIFASDGSIRKWSGMNIDITERKKAERVLRANAWRQDFLLRLGDVLRTISDPREVQSKASKLLSEYLHADRVGYAEARPDGETIVVESHYVQGVPCIEGEYRYADYGEGLLHEFLAGRTVIRPDIANDPLLSPSSAV